MPALSPAQMAKSLAESLLGARDIGIDVPSTVSDSLAAQWRNPNGVLSILLLLGPDIVQKAIAQLTGRVVTPVAFSFGWVAYAASSILSVVSGGRLMPACDTPEPEVIGAESGHKRTTKNWVLSRLLRDLEYGIDKEMLNEQDHGTTKSAVQDQAPPRPAWEALRISVFKVDESRQHGVPSLDWVWFSGFAIIIIQLLISIIPWIIDANWAVFMLTLLGNVLALIGSSLPQWRKEKWACTRQGGSTVTLTRGNGSRYAILILGKKGVGLDLEILAQGTRTVRPSWVTGIIVGIIAVLWIMLLLCANEVDQNTWYLLGIGLLGSIQNVVAAGAVRKPGAHGIHISHITMIKADKVSKALREVEENYPFVGTSLLDVFFPGSMRVKEPDLSFWRTAQEARFADNQFGTRLDKLPLASKSLESSAKES